jgi:hypothetical protein
VIAMIVQPTVSSMIAEASSVIPTLRRTNFISLTTDATILTEATERAVPRNKEVTRSAFSWFESYQAASASL